MPLLPFDADRLAPLCAELDTWRTRLDRRGVLSRRWSGQMRRELEVEAVAASVSMEQVPVTVEDVRRILVGDRPANVSELDQALVRGYRDAMEFVLRRADDPGFQWNRELIVGLHDRVLAGRFDLGAGRLAVGDRWVVNRLTHEVVFDPAPWADVPLLIDQACEWMEDAAHFAHPAVASAWIHVVVAAIHPFRDGNGRVARVLASLAMYRGGFQRKEFTSLEEWWGRHLTDYYAAFACLGRRFDASRDVTPFIEAHVDAQLGQVRALDIRQRVEREIWAAIDCVVEDSSLPQRTIYALWDAFFGREVTSAYYVPLAEVSRQTATNDFNALVAAGLLRAEGERRWRRYYGTGVLHERVARLAGLEPLDVPGHEWIVAALTQAIRDERQPFRQLEIPVETE